MPAEFHFLRPEWLLAIPAIIFVAILLARRQLGAGHWRDVVDPELMPCASRAALSSCGERRSQVSGDSSARVSRSMAPGICPLR